MLGWRFSRGVNEGVEKSIFDTLLEILKEILLYTSGDLQEALAWLTEIDREHKITNEDYGMADFIQDLLDKGYIQRTGEGGQGRMGPSSKMEQAIRKKSLEDIFGKLKKSKLGNHNLPSNGKGDESNSDFKPYEFGDRLDRLAMSETLLNAQINHGLDDFWLEPEDMVIHETYSQTRMSTVLMIDISHSMILYGEDRITPAKKVALALAEFIQTKYPKDSLDVIVFGNDAWRIKLSEIPYLQVGPYHTNTVAGLELAMKILQKRKNPNKQILMITDGKPTCVKIGKKYYKNPYGLDRKIVSRTLNLAGRFKKQGVHITTFMIAQDPYLQNFVENFTRANAGKAFYSSLDGLGDFVLSDYQRKKSRRF